MTAPQDTVRTVAPWGDEVTVTRLRQELHDAEVERATRREVSRAAQAAWGAADDRFVAAKKALLDHLGIPR